MTSYSGSRVSLHIHSSFFAILGRRTGGAEVPADAASPPSAYFQIRREIPMDLQLDLAIVWEP